MSGTEKFGLRLNPFHHLVREQDAKIWAGMPDTKKRIKDVVQSVLPDDIGSSEFVLLVGDIGGGKTHALRYFSNKIRNNNRNGYPFYASKTVRGDRNIFAQVFRSLMDECGNEFFSQLGGEIQRSSEKAAADKGQHGQGDTLAQSAFDPFEGKLVAALRSGTAEAFIKEKAKDDAAAATWMAALIKIMTTSIEGQPAPYPAVYFFLDEVEEILDLKPAVYDPFFRSCRELVNRIDGQFAMVFALSTDTAVIEATIHPALLDRMTRPYILIEDLDIDGAKQFVRDFLASYRISDFNPPHPFYPFTEEAVDFILEREKALLPRKIIMTMGRVFKRGSAKLEEGEEFSKEITEEVLTEMGV